MDELSTYLSQNYNSYLTGYQDCNILLWGLPTKNYSVPKFISAIVGLNYNPNNITRDEAAIMLRRYYKSYKMFYRICQYGEKLTHQCNLPFVIIAYPKIEGYRHCEWEGSIAKYELDKVKFLMYQIPDKNAPGKLLTGKELREMLCLLVGAEKAEVIGTRKPKNKRIADYFQYWSRNYMPSSITKLDVDGGFFYNGNSRVFVEIKRSAKPPIPNWRPYVNDKANYRLQYDFCSVTGMDCWILHHEGLDNPCTPDTVISYFNVDGFKENKLNPDDFLSYKAMQLRLPLGGENSLDSIIRKEYGME